MKYILLLKYIKSHLTSMYGFQCMPHKTKSKISIIKIYLLKSITI